jgi:alpha-tubulin suppressor-like RCC1 family protein
MRSSWYNFFETNNGTIKCCGYNYYGQLGLGYATTTSPFKVPTLTDLPLTGVKNIACGLHHTFFVMNDGTIKVCGNNEYGQLGLGHTTSPITTLTDLPFTGVKNIVCGYHHTFFIMEDGTVKCCGDNSGGQLGLGNTTTVYTVTNLPLTGVKNIVCDDHTFFIMQDGTVKCCGYNRYGQLGLDHTNTQVELISHPLVGIKKIVCGAECTFFIMRDGAVKACGHNGSGQLGLGFLSPGRTRLLSDVPITGVKDIVCGGYYTFFIIEDGTVKACGNNGSGKLGLGYATDNQIQVTDVPITGIKKIVCLDANTFFILEDNTLMGCGGNRNGTLGLNNTEAQISPVVISTLPDFSKFLYYDDDGEVPDGPPKANNVYIIGEPQVGQTLIGDYEYIDPNGDLEGESTFRWLRADTENGEYTAIPGATGTTHTITEEDIGKYIKFEVTPVSL